MDLQSLKFKVETGELKEAADKLESLIKSVGNLKSAIKNMPTLKIPGAGGGSGGSSSSVPSMTTGVSQKASSSVKTFNSLMGDLVNLQKDLVDGFTRGESGWLKQARAIKLSSDQMEEFKAKIKEVGKLFKDPFDSSLGSLRAVNQEFDKLNTRAELVRKGISLTANQLKEFSRLSTEVEGKMLAAGKKLNSKGMFEGADLKEYTAKLEIVREAYIKQALVNNELERAEKHRLKESARLENEKVKLMIEGETMMNQAVLQFRKNEQIKREEIEKTLRLTAQLEQKTALLAQGYSRGEATSIVSGMSKGVDRSTIDNLIAAQRAQSTALSGRVGSTDISVKAARELAKAEKYLIDVEERLNEQLNATSQSMDRRATDQLVKIRNAIKVTGQSTTEAGGKFDILRQKVEAVASKDSQRRLDYLARAISVQMGDVAISLASGMNPFLVMIQQGDQIRGAIEQSGAAGKELSKAMSTAAAQIALSFRDTGKAIGGFFVSAVRGAGEGVVNLTLQLLGLDETYRKMNNSLLVSSALGNKFATTMLAITSASKLLIGVGVIGLIAGLATLAVGLYKVIKAEDNLVKNLALSNGAMGLTTDAAMQYAEAMESMGVTSGKAYEAISAMGKSGNLVASEIQMVTVAAVELNKYAGVAIEDTVKVFSDLKKDPVDALMKVARETGMVSIETIKMVNDLALVGKTADAQALAMKTYAEVTQTQVKRMKDEYSDFAIFIKEWGALIGQAFDQVFTMVWKKASPKEALGKQMLELDEAISNMTKHLQTAGKAGLVVNGRWLDSNNENLQSLQKLRMELDKQYSGFSKTAKAQEDAAAKTKEHADLIDKANSLKESGYSKEAKHLREIANLEKDRDKATSFGDPESAKFFQTVIDAKKKEYEESKKVSKEETEANKIKKEAETIVARLRDKQEELNGQLEERNTQETEYEKILNNANFKKYPEEIQKLIKLLLGQNIEIQRSINRKKAEADATAHLVKKLSEEEKAREALDDIIRNSWSNDESLNRALKDEAEMLNLESQLMFQNEEFRKRTLKTKQNEITLRKELLDIQNQETRATALAGEQGLDPSQIASFEALRNAAQNRYRERSVLINTEIVNDQMKKWVDMYNNLQQGIADAISTALFEGGKAGRKKLRDVIVAELRKPIEIYVKAGVELLTQGASGFVQALAGNGNYLNSGNSSQAVLNGVSTGQKAMEWGSKVYSGYQSGGIAGAWGSATGTGAISSSALLTTDIGVGTASAGSGTTATAGTSMGMYALYAAAIYAGVTKAMSAWDEGFNTQSTRQVSSEMGGLGYMEATTSSMFQKLGVSQKWADLLSGATLIAKYFGMGKVQAEESGIQGNFSAGEFSGKGFQDFFQKGGILRKSKWWTELSELDDGINNLMNDISSSTRETIKDYASVLGLASDDIDSVRTEVKIATTNDNLKALSDKYGEDLSKPFDELSDAGKRIAQSTEFSDAIKADQERNLKEITNAATSYGIAMADTFSNVIKEYSVYGESSIDTLTRLGLNLKSVNTVMQDLGLSLFESSLAGADAASNFISLFDSIEGMNSAFSFYYENFYSAEEKLQSTTDTLTAKFNELGLTMPNSIDSFKALVTAASAAGDNTLVANLVKLAPNFLDVQKAADELNGSLSNLTSKDVKSAFYDMADTFFSGDDLKFIKLTQLKEELAEVGIVVNESMLASTTSTEAYGYALEYFNAGLYDKAMAVLTVAEKLNSISVSSSDVGDAFESVAEIFYSADQIRSLKVSKVIGMLNEAGIAVDENMVLMADSTQVYNYGLELFNQGMYDKALALVGVVDLLKEISPDSFMTESERIQARIDELTESMVPLEAEMQSLIDTYGDVVSAAAEINGNKTLVDMWTENKGKLDELRNGLESLVPTKALTNLEKLSNVLNVIASVKGQIDSVRDKIFSIKTSSKSQESVDLMKAKEAQLFSEIATGSDPAGAAGKLVELTLSRLDMESELKNSIFEKEKTALELRQESLEKEIDLAQSFNDLIVEMKSFVAELKFGDLSALNPEDQLSAARSEYERVLALAKSGDTDAMGKLQSISSSYLQEAQGHYGGATSPYADIYSSVIADVEGIANMPLTDVELLQLQLDKTNEILNDSSQNTELTRLQLTSLNTIEEALVSREASLESEKETYIDLINQEIGILNDLKELQEAAIAQQAAIYAANQLKLEKIQQDIETMSTNGTLELSRP